MLSDGHEKDLANHYRNVRERLGPLQDADKKIRVLGEENKELKVMVEELEERNFRLENRELKRRVEELEGCIYRLGKTNEALRAEIAGATPLDTIVEGVARHYGVTVRDLRSARRTKCLTLPRQVAMYLAKTLTLKSLPEIGKRLGGRDHTTVMHGVRKIENRRPIDPDLDAALTDLEVRLAP